MPEWHLAVWTSTHLGHTGSLFSHSTMSLSLDIVRLEDDLTALDLNTTDNESCQWHYSEEHCCLSLCLSLSVVCVLIALTLLVGRQSVNILLQQSSVCSPLDFCSREVNCQIMHKVVVKTVVHYVTEVTGLLLLLLLLLLLQSSHRTHRVVNL